MTPSSARQPASHESAADARPPARVVAGLGGGPSPRTGCHARAAFTLIELLVVISIVALLIALLLPAMGAVRERARETLCTSNIRQLSIGQLNYAADNNDRPRSDGDPTRNEGNLDRYNNGGSIYGGPNSWGDVLYWLGMITELRVYHCPTDDVPLSFPAQRPYKMSYGINGYIGAQTRLMQVAVPSNRILMGETRGNGLDSVGAWNFRAPGVRHTNDRGSYVFFDGSAGLPPFADIWGQDPDPTIPRLANGQVDLPLHWQTWYAPPSGNWGHKNNDNAELFPPWAFWK